jgi:membrane protein DedA with SNARE-associated domain
VEHVTQFFLGLVDQFGYPGLFLVMVVGNCGLPVGTELVLPAAGALAATGHLSSWWLAAAVATVAEVVGGSILYAIGYYGGRPFVARWGKVIKLDEHKLDRFHAFYERHGSVVVFVCRFIPFVRGVSGLPAGVSRMQKRSFLVYTTLGSAIFCFALAWLGNVFGSHLAEIIPQIRHYSLALAALVAVAIVLALAYAARRKQVISP